MYMKHVRARILTAMIRRACTYKGDDMDVKLKLDDMQSTYEHVEYLKRQR